MSVLLAGAHDFADGSPAEVSSSVEPHRHSGVAPAGTHREAPLGEEKPSQPPQSFREADDHVQLALVESSHAEVNLALLVRGLHNLLAGAGAARDAHSALTRELSSLRELLARGSEAELAVTERLRAAEEQLAESRRDAERERQRFIDEEDRFIAELLDDHERELAALRARLDEALARGVEPLAPSTGELSKERLGSAATQPSFPAAQWTPSTGAFAVAEWTTPEPSFAQTDWSPQPPFSLREFETEQKSPEFERELVRRLTPPPMHVSELLGSSQPPTEASAVARTAPDDGGPTLHEAQDVEDDDAQSGLIDRMTGRVLSAEEAILGADPSATPLPVFRAATTLASLNAPPLLEEPPPDSLVFDDPEIQEDSTTLLVEEEVTSSDLVTAPDEPLSVEPEKPASSGAVIGAIKPKSVRMQWPQEVAAIEPADALVTDQVTDQATDLVEDPEPEPLTVRHNTPLPPLVEDAEAYPAPHTVETVRPPPLMKPLQDFSKRPLREYSLGSTDVAEEHVEGQSEGSSEPH